MTDRRYTDEDVRRILALAAEAETAAVVDADRPWSLKDIERIGAEAGIAPEAVSSAAFALERQHALPDDASRLFGLPVTVTRAVPLGRHLTDEDWDRLVGELRDTFAARGHSQVTGARREWRVGNLRVTHEPLGTGAVLDFRTRKGDARAFLQMATIFLVIAAVAGFLSWMGVRNSRGHNPFPVLAWISGLVGAFMLAVGVLRLPAWARRRAQQFEALAVYARRIAST